MWETLYFVGALIIAAAIAIGVFQSRRRNPANDAITEAATKDLYADADQYEASGRKQQLKDQLHPS